MISDIGYIPVFGKPLVLWLGIITAIGFASTATVMVLNLYTKIRIPVKYHHWLAGISLALMMIHAALAIAIYI